MAYVSRLDGPMTFLGNFMYVADKYHINKFNLTTRVNRPGWCPISIDYINMGIYDGYLYRTDSGNKIYKINLNKPKPINKVWLFAAEEDNLLYMCIDGPYMYLIHESSSGNKVLQVNIPTCQFVNTFDFGSSPIGSICKYGKYVYVFNGKYISRINLIDNSVNTEWFKVPKDWGYDLAAYGDYVYAAVNDGIIQISIDATTYTNFSSSDTANLCVYNGTLYGSSYSGTYAYALTETLVYSQNDLEASSIATPAGKRGTALLRPRGKRRPIGLIEMITRKVKHRKRVITYDCTITFFERGTAISCRFVNVSNGPVALTGNAIASGPYKSAKLSITPKGNMRVVKVSHI